MNKTIAEIDELVRQTDAYKEIWSAIDKLADCIGALIAENDEHKSDPDLPNIDAPEGVVYNFRKTPGKE